MSLKTSTAPTTLLVFLDRRLDEFHRKAGAIFAMKDPLVRIAARERSLAVGAIAAEDFLLGLSDQFFERPAGELGDGWIGERGLALPDPGRKCPRRRNSGCAHSAAGASANPWCAPGHAAPAPSWSFPAPAAAGASVLPARLSLSSSACNGNSTTPGRHPLLSLGSQLLQLLFRFRLSASWHSNWPAVLRHSASQVLHSSLPGAPPEHQGGDHRQQEPRATRRRRR